MTRMKLLFAFALLAAPAVSRAEVGTLVAELKIGTGTKDKEAIGVSDSFPANTEWIVGWTRVKGAREPVTITHLWIYKGAEAMRVPLQIQSSSFRTHSRLEVKGRTGAWEMQVLDPDGKVLASKTFDVK